MARNVAFQGGGKIRLRIAGSADPFLPLGNADDFSFAINEDKKNQPDRRKPGGGNAASSSLITDVALTINGLSYQSSTLAIGLRALIDVVTGKVNAAESVAFMTVVDGFTPTVELIDLEQTVTVTEATVGELTEGVHYKLSRSGITCLQVSANAVTISYTSPTTHKVKALSGTSLEYEIHFDGFNNSDSGKAVVVRAWRAKFSPTTALALINESFGALPMTIDLISDDTKTSGDSRYFNMYMEQ